MHAGWRTMLEEAREEALLAVDLYNQPRQARRLDVFLLHMHIAWLYLLHASLRRQGISYHYTLPNGRVDRVDGEPRTWDLAECVARRWELNHPVRKNLELTIGLRHNIEHRYHESIALVASGYAQALLINFEQELTAEFGPAYSLGEDLRVPIFVGSMTALGRARIDGLRDAVPKPTSDFIAHFEGDLSTDVAADQRYEFRMTLVPRLGRKEAADAAITFVRESDLNDEERDALRRLGTAGSVVVREKTRSVASAGLLKPSRVVRAVAKRTPFKFNMKLFVDAWHITHVRPPGDAQHPERTVEKYCVYDEPHKDYLYTPEFVEKLIDETSSADKFTAFFGQVPTMKNNPETGLLPSGNS
ncbi:hypothetical protein BH10ACT2_BH10ACT2_06670 [soil metagenome]